MRPIFIGISFSHDGTFFEVKVSRPKSHTTENQ
nr:MAG TPA: hypothetical protein [Caudoviricetes sp.]